MSCCEIWNNIKILYLKIDNTLKQEKFVYIFNTVILIIGFSLTLFYWCLEYLDHETLKGEILMRSGAILILHSIIVESTLASIKHYTINDNIGFCNQKILVEKPIPFRYQLQKRIALLFMIAGTLLWGFGDLLIISFDKIKNIILNY